MKAGAGAETRRDWNFRTRYRPSRRFEEEKNTGKMRKKRNTRANKVEFSYFIVAEQRSSLCFIRAACGERVITRIGESYRHAGAEKLQKKRLIARSCCCLINNAWQCLEKFLTNDIYIYIYIYMYERGERNIIELHVYRLFVTSFFIWMLPGFVFDIDSRYIG